MNWVCALFSAITVESVSAAAQLITGVAVAVGVWIAWRQLGSWRDEAKSKRKALIAEELLDAAYACDRAIKYVRNPWGTKAPENDANPDTFARRERMNRSHEKQECFERLGVANVRSKAILGVEEVNAAVDALFDVKQEVDASLASLATRAGGREDTDTEAFYEKCNRSVFGSYSERDELGTRQIKAIESLEEHLFPFVRFEIGTKK